MKKISILFVSFIVFTLTACSGPQTPVKELRKLADEVEMNYDSYTDEEIENVLEKLDSIDTEMQQYEYTGEELRVIGRLNGRVSMYLAKAYLKRAGSELGEITQGLMGGMEGVLDALSGGSDTDIDEVLHEEARMKGRLLGKCLRDMAITLGSGLEGFAEEFEKEIETLAEDLEDDIGNMAEELE